MKKSLYICCSAYAGRVYGLFVCGAGVGSGGSELHAEPLKPMNPRSEMIQLLLLQILCRPPCFPENVRIESQRIMRAVHFTDAVYLCNPGQ